MFDEMFEEGMAKPIPDPKFDPIISRPKGSDREVHWYPRSTIYWNIDLIYTYALAMPIHSEGKRLIEIAKELDLVACCGTTGKFEDQNDVPYTSQATKDAFQAAVKERAEELWRICDRLPSHPELRQAVIELAGPKPQPRVYNFED
jgi:hypothetical protein